MSAEVVAALIQDLGLASKTKVFAAIDTLVENDVAAAIEPLRQLLSAAQKLKIKLRAAAALKRLGWTFTPDETAALRDTLNASLRHQDIDTRLLAVSVLVQCPPQESIPRLLDLMTTAARFDEKKNTFEFTDEQFRALLDVIAAHATSELLAALVDTYVRDQSFRYSVERTTHEPHSMPAKMKESGGYGRTVAVWRCVEELLRSSQEKPEQGTLDRLTQRHRVTLSADEYTIIGDDSRDQSYVVDCCESAFAGILAKRGWG